MASKKKAALKTKIRFPKATEKDFSVIAKPIITEKAMDLMQNENKVTLKVLSTSTKIEIKLTFERIFQVKVDDVKVLNQKAKATTRGTRYPGKISGYKKAIVTVAEGEAIDLFKE
ncbi:MAG: 50S ribosomal protein L23 [Erysipelotrichia bacterium]|nr:50S ribosomal protein L23 [Erysipelotrichia bacterium]